MWDHNLQLPLDEIENRLFVHVQTLGPGERVFIKVDFWNLVLAIVRVILISLPFTPPPPKKNPFQVPNEGRKRLG